MTEKQIQLTYKDLQVIRPAPQRYQEILTDGALEFLSQLVERFAEPIVARLQERQKMQEKIDAGELPDFFTETAHIRDGDWIASPLPSDLQNRRVEITGPVERKMMINALNSDANVFMADFEDSNSPTWDNIIQGQVNLYDAVRRTIEYTKPDGSKHYSLNEDVAVLMVRPRGLHLVEAGILYREKPVPASLVDFGLYFYHNAVALLDHDTGPYFYLPKLQHYKEARLWNEIFEFAQQYLDIKLGTIKATVLLEHILAAFQMDEIIYELRQHCAGLNSGRWDYIFSFIKTFGKREDFVLPDRMQITMDRHFLRSYVQLLVKTCHRRKVHGMGGMAAQIPIKDDPEKNQQALDKVRADKIREVNAGHDGTWVAHPGLIAIAQEAFATMDGDNQIDLIPDVEITQQDLLQVPTGEVTEQGVRTNITVGLRYLAAWLQGNGCVPIFNLMEDAATAEISRTQLWQWVNHQVELENGSILTPELFQQLLDQEVNKLQQEMGGDIFNTGGFELAKQIFRDLTLREELAEFLTIESYDYLTTEVIL